MAEEIDALKRYRAGLIKQGRLHDADMVAKCIRLIKTVGSNPRKATTGVAQNRLEFPMDSLKSPAGARVVV